MHMAGARIVQVHGMHMWVAQARVAGEQGSRDLLGHRGLT